MRKVIPKNIADEMTQPYIDDAVEKQIKAADVPPRNKLNISFENADRTDDNKEYKSNQEAYEKNHGKLYDMTHKNTIPWKNYVVYIVLLSLLTCVFTFSKYMSGTTGSSDAVVASFKVDVVGDSACNITASSPTIKLAGGYLGAGSSQEIVFTAQNSSDVAVYLTWSCDNSSNCTINSFTRVDGKIDEDPSDSKLYIKPATCDAGGTIIPSTRKVKLKLTTPESGEDAAGNLKLSFVFEQVD